MPIPYRPDPPDLQTVRLAVNDASGNAEVSFDRWTSYTFATDFVTPTDSFSLELGVDELGLPDKQRAALRLGAKVRLHVQDNILADGRLDSIEISADRSSGRTYHLHGRDRLGQALDAVADPTFQLKEGGTLADLLKRLFGPLGWSSDAQFEVDNTANRDARTGGARGARTTKKGKPLKSFVLHQTKPYNHESVFHFASRVAQRQGLWIWCSADGEKLIIGKPDFEQEPLFTLVRDAKGNGNVISGSVSYNMTDQPSVIVADGFAVGGSGEFGKGRIKSFIVNPLLGLTDEGEHTPEVKALLAKYRGAEENTLAGASFAFRASGIPFRPMFLHDSESKTKEQLNNFVKREMALLYHKALTASYVVEGHGQTIDGSFVAWAPDTMVQVLDEAAELRETLYVLGVSFQKSRRGGTTTRLDLVRKNSIMF